MSHHPSARRIWTFLEILVSASLIPLGIYLLVVANSNRSKNDDVMILPAAMCLAAGATSLVYAMQSLLWHRKMTKRATNYVSREKAIAQRELLEWEESIQSVGEATPCGETFAREIAENVPGTTQALP